jgi:hypothetical protein
MKRLNVMSGMLAFSFPCIVGAGIASPKSAQADGQILVDTITYNLEVNKGAVITDQDSLLINYKELPAIK